MSNKHNASSKTRIRVEKTALGYKIFTREGVFVRTGKNDKEVVLRIVIFLNDVLLKQKRITKKEKQEIILGLMRFTNPKKWKREQIAAKKPKELTSTRPLETRLLKRWPTRRN